MNKFSLKYAVMLATCLCLWMTGAAAASEAPAMEEESLYGIGSVSKVVTAAAVLKLSQEGKIDLDAPLYTYIPEFNMADPRYVDITPRMLLDHTSGIAGSTLANSMLFGDPDTYNHDHLLESLGTQRLKADPGAFGTYCNDGFTLAEILVERVTQMTFTQYLQVEMANVLNLKSFLSPQSRFSTDRLARIYDPSNGQMLPYEAPNVIGSGGIYASAEDLCLFSQIFMRDNTTGFLSKESQTALEYSQYLDLVGGANQDSILAYGLGWDSVNAYPFNRYGIQALSKGGDTSFYHGNLTVLPEENISCAVLSSGGSSTFNQMAAQEILLTYLEEIGRIKKEEQALSLPETSPDLHTMPIQLTGYSGWYAGRDLIQVTIREDGLLRLTAKGNGHSMTQEYVYHRDGYFYSQNGTYVDIDGDLSLGSNGQIGKTRLSFETSKDGVTYLMAGSHVVYPGLSTSALYLPMAQKLEAYEAEPHALAAWMAVDGKEYYMVSDKYTSTAYTTNFMTKLNVNEELGGYLTFDQSLFTMARIETDSLARFFQQIPGQMGRDLHDYQLLVKDGVRYFSSGDYLFISEDGLRPFVTQDFTVTIGQNGETLWYANGQEMKGKKIAITCPENGAFYVYEHGKKSSSCIQSSYTLMQGQTFSLPNDGRMAFAGEPGATFVIQITD